MAGGGLVLTTPNCGGIPQTPGVTSPSGIPLAPGVVPLADALPSFEQYLQYLFMSLPPPPPAFYAAAAQQQVQQLQQEQLLLKKQAETEDIEEKVDVVSSTPEPTSEEK